MGKIFKTFGSVIDAANYQIDRDRTPDIILLDNFNLEDTKFAIDKIQKINLNIQIECSGGITPEKLEGLSKLGLVGVSMGYLTHTTRFLDLSLEIESK